MEKLSSQKRNRPTRPEARKHENRESEVANRLDKYLTRLTDFIENSVEKLPRLDFTRIKSLVSRLVPRLLVTAAVFAGILSFRPGKVSAAKPFILNAHQKIEMQEAATRADAAYVAIIGDEIADAGINGASEFIGVALDITGDDFQEEISEGRILLIAPDQMDLDGGGDDRAIDTSQMDTAELNSQIEQALSQLVAKAQNGEINEINIFILTHGVVDASGDFTSVRMNQVGLYGAKLFERTFVDGLSGLPDDVRTIFMIGACHGGALITGSNITDQIPNSVVAASTQAPSNAFRRGLNEKKVGTEGASTGTISYAEFFTMGVFPRMRAGSSLGEAFRDTALTIQTAQYPVIQATGHQAETDKGDQTIPPRVVENITFGGSINQEEVSVEDEGRVTFVDRVSNPTTNVVTWTVNVQSSNQYTVTAPGEIVLQPRTSQTLTVGVDLGGAISPSEYITAMVTLLESETGRDIVFTNRRLPSSIHSLISFSPETASYHYRPEEKVYIVEIPILYSTVISSVQVATQGFNDAWFLNTYYPEEPTLDGRSEVTMTFLGSSWPPERIGLSIYFDTIYVEGPEVWRPGDLQRDGAVYLPLVIRN